ncbi:hypothetical protein [Parvibaculum sp.]|jgi:hypothetical protein|uniref:hypothetical protein n=1 Tax=Parvibaculum sp. TaxID=2024848 RepID=UPI0025FE45C7|nr:hypothetical protein [Parvibaculum sp.]
MRRVGVQPVRNLDQRDGQGDFDEMEPLRPVDVVLVSGGMLISAATVVLALWKLKDLIF